MNALEVFSKNMRRYRKAAGLTQEQLAEVSGLHRTYIGRIEQQRVNVSINNASRIAEALGVSMALMFVECPDDVVLLPEADGATGGDGSGESSSDGDGRSEYQYALCKISGDKVELESLDVEDPDLTVQILCSLITDGYGQDELASEYKHVEREILDFLRDRNRDARKPVAK